MALNLYSKETTDTLLGAKLSDAPIDGTTYARKNGAWEAIGGGGGGTWGSITGTLSDQTDLWTALGGKADLTSPSFAGTVYVTGSWGVVQIGDASAGIAIYDGSMSYYTAITPSGVRFPDGTTQTTAASPDWFAMSYAGICSALAVNLTSIANNVLTFNVGSYFIPQNVVNGGSIGLTQDGTNFYPFDTIVSGNNVFQASTFSLDTANYAYLAFKDSGGTWHWCPNGIVFYP